MLKHLFSVCLFSIVIAGNSLYSQTVSFSSSNLNVPGLTNPTTLQFGPDGRLYVGRQDGTIHALTIQRNGPNNYQILDNEVITIIKTIPNHNDDGTVNTSVVNRQLTGIAVAGTPTNPVLYVTSSDPRIGGGNGSINKNLDTNSGVISKLTKNGNSWTKVDLVRGLPRSEENHATNDLILDKANNKLYVGQGGNTNMGAPSNNFVNLPEYAYSAAILSVDLTAIGNTTYDLPTLDDETRNNTSAVLHHEDVSDPFGGNDGKNQAMLEANGPVQVYAPGFRNPYDVLITQAGKMYTWDNGPNAQWGDEPTNCSNSVQEPGIAECDHFHYISGPGYYAGHPNPTRANRNNKFNSSNPQSPIPAGMENPAECTYIDQSYASGEITSNCASTNGLAEYTASNFNNAMKGNILACGYNGKLLRLKLDASGTQLASTGGKTELASGIGSNPLDVTAQGDTDIFPGTIWIAMYASHDVVVLEPNDYIICTPDSNSYVLDSDNDGFSDGDEYDNGTDMCSPSSKPSDYDGDRISNLNDPDDDNDGILDQNDAFALDSTNGTSTTIPVIYAFDNSNDGGVEGWGFTGLMKNGVTNYKDQYDPLHMTVGGAARKFTVDQVTSGDAYQGLNNQDHGFQFGVNTSSYRSKFAVHTRVMGPFNGITPQNSQSIGLFIGTGDQDNYLKIVCAANGGAGGIQVLKEEAGVTSANMYGISILGSTFVDLFLDVDPSTNTVQPMYSTNAGAKSPLGSPIAINPSWIANVLAVGIISTANGSGTTFAATWDFIEVIPSAPLSSGSWEYVNTNNLPVARQECSFVRVGDKFYLIGGRSYRPVNVYDPATNTWATKAYPPFELHHFQAVEFNGLIYVMCAFTGTFPNETPVDSIYTYNPTTNVWSSVASIPAARRRGAAGAVVYNNEIYVVSGIQNGHLSGWVPWTDKFNPTTKTWTTLADAPRSRDHFMAVVANNKIYAMGGRRSGANGTFKATIGEVDVYDIATNHWSTLPAGSNVPTQRAACPTVLVGNEILMVGGESGQPEAHNQTEALDINTNTWRTLDSLNQARHGTNLILYNNQVFIAAGSGHQGGSPELNSMEVLSLSTNSTAPIVSIADPANGTTYNDLTNIKITATAFDIDGTIQNVDFYVGNVKIGDANNVPYNFLWTNIAPGNYVLTAVATDNDNKTTTSSPVNISVSGGLNGVGIVNLSLMNADNDQEIQILNDGDVINLQALPTTNLNVRANTSPSVIGSVKFGLNGNPNFRTESGVPYALAGDNQGDFNPWTPPLGDNTITTTPYTGSGASGDAGAIYTVHFLVINQAGVPDCNGDLGGTAITDQCGICAGGNTGIIPNANLDCEGNCFGSAVLDCNGDCNGTATLNACNICVGGNTGLGPDAGKDCNGVCGGSAIEDCNGVCGGTAVLDCNGICGGSTPTDCNGDCNGTATLNSCNICVGGNTGLGVDAGKDCSGVCGGTAAIDNCGQCAGGNTGIVPGSSCAPPCVQNEVVSFTLMHAGTAGVIGPLVNGATINLATIGSFSIRADVCSSPVGSVKFILNGSTFRTETAVPYALNGDSPSGNYSAWNPTVGTYTLIGRPYTGPSGTGTAGIDETITFTVINQAIVNDCNGVPNGTAFLDGCGACVGGNTGLIAGYLKDCNGDCNGTATTNICGMCVGGNTGLGPNAGKDCNGVCGGSAVLDCNGVCGGTAILDCHGDCNGTATLNACNVCVGGNTGLGTDAGKDCHGDCGGSAAIDVCGQCAGGNTGIVPGSSCAPPCVQNEVISFTLMHAGTSGPIGPLVNGGTINLATIGNFSIRADVCSTPVGSVKFILNGSTIRTESTPPYAINGDSPAGNYTAWKPNVGSYTLTATPYTGSNASGSAGVSETISFTVINQLIVNDCHGDLGGTAYYNSCGTCVGGNTGLPATYGMDCNGTCGGTAFYNSCNVCVGGTTGLGPNQGQDCNGVCGGSAVLDCNNVCGGTAVLDDCGICGGDNSGCDCTLKVSSFTLMRAGNGGPIGPLNNGDVINLSSAGNINVRADLCQLPVGSVKFLLNGSTFRVESTAPYALAGDNNGSYYTWNVSPGTYTLQGIPYSGAGASGASGTAKTITFTVVSSSSKVTGIEDAQNDSPAWEIYPNPNNGNFIIKLNTPEESQSVISIFNNIGQLIYQEDAVFSGEVSRPIDLSSQPAGVYLVRIQGSSFVANKKVIVE